MYAPSVPSYVHHGWLYKERQYKKERLQIRLFSAMCATIQQTDAAPRGPFHPRMPRRRQRNPVVLENRVERRSGEDSNMGPAYKTKGKGKNKGKGKHTEAKAKQPEQKPEQRHLGSILSHLGSILGHLSSILAPS